MNNTIEGENLEQSIFLILQENYNINKNHTLPNNFRSTCFFADFFVILMLLCGS